MLDDVFSALGDPVRRSIVERLARGELTAGEIASAYKISQPAVSKHIKILERCGLLQRTVVGREHNLRLVPRQMRSATKWLQAQEAFWNSTFDRLDTYLQESAESEKK